MTHRTLESTLESCLLVPLEMTAHARKRKPVPHQCLALRTAQEEAARERLHAMRDDLHEKVVALRASHARLEEAQEHETRAAALAERTRIARDIHDGVGHLLTRLLL